VLHRSKGKEAALDLAVAEKVERVADPASGCVYVPVA